MAQGHFRYNALAGDGRRSRHMPALFCEAFVVDIHHCGPGRVDRE